MNYFLFFLGLSECIDSFCISSPLSISVLLFPLFVLIGLKVTITVLIDPESPVEHNRAWRPLLSHFKHVENSARKCSIRVAVHSVHTDVMGSSVEQVGSMQGLEERSTFLGKFAS